MVQICVACTQRPQPVLRVGSNVWPGYEPLYLARDLGWLDSSNLRLVEFPSATQVIHGLRSETIEAACLTLDEVLVLLAKGVNVRLGLVLDYSSGADALLGGPDIPALPHLAGARIGYEDTALGAYFLSRALDLAGLAATDIVAVPLEVDRHEAAMHAKQVDAVVTFEPVLGRLRAKGATVLIDSRQLPTEVVDVLVVRRDVWQSKLVDELRDHWFNALQHIREDPRKSSALMSKRLSVSPLQVLDSLKLLHFPSLSENGGLLRSSDSALAATANRLMQHMVRRGLLPHPVNIEGLFQER